MNSKTVIEPVWETEPDLEYFEAYGYKCVVHRLRTLKYWTGYVIISNKNHPWYGDDPRILFGEIEVHGGITYADFSPFSDSTEDWYVGFHCGHPFDLIPYFWEQEGHNYPRLFRNHIYRDINFAIEQTKLLAKQAKDAERIKI